MNLPRLRTSMSAGLLVLFCLSLFAACSSTPKKDGVPEFRYVKTTLTDKMKSERSSRLPGKGKHTFNTEDNYVVAHVELENISGKHRIEWQWYDPYNRLYLESAPYIMKIARGKYARKAGAWHHINIRGDKAMHRQGEWQVKILVDGDLVDTKSFTVASKDNPGGQPPYLMIGGISLSKPLIGVGDTAELKVEVKNSGKGYANDVYIELTSEADGLEFPQRKVIRKIDKEDGVQVATIPIRGNMALKTAKASLQIQVVEPHFKIKLKGKQVTFHTQKFLNPDLLLAQYLADDQETANANGQIDLYDTITLKFAVQNIGQGSAKGIAVEVFNEQEGVMFMGAGQEGQFSTKKGNRVQLEDMNSGKYQIVNYKYYINSDFMEDELVFDIKGLESYGKWGFSEVKKIPINTELKAEGEIRDVALRADAAFLGSAAVIEDVPDLVVDVDSNIPKTRMDNPTAVAVVIGNRIYESNDIPGVNFAWHDADIVKRYLIDTLGYHEKNIIFEKDISKTDFHVLFGDEDDPQGMLMDWVRPGISDVFVYYSGHGAPDPNNEKAYFVPNDFNPAKISLTGYSLDLFYKNIGKLNAKSVTVVIDACFSGGLNSGENLMKNASPALVVVKNPVVKSRNGHFFTSSKEDEISSWYTENNHGLFTYFLLKGMGGAADGNKDRQLTYKELHQYISDKHDGVPYFARRLYGRKQTPTYSGRSPESILIDYSAK